jgi:poly(A) polymerase
MPRRFTQFARDVWQLQPRLTRRAGKKPHRLLSHPKFRAAYDFLILRAQAGEDVQELVDWWTDFQKQHSDLVEAGQMRKPAGKSRGRKFQRRPRKSK